MRRCALLVSLLLAAALAGSSPLRAGAGAAEPDAALKLGFAVAPEDLARLADRATDWAGAPLLRLTAERDQIETERGVFDWSALDAALGALAGAGHELALVIDGAASTPGDPLEDWLRFVREATRRYAGRVRTFQVGSTIDAVEPGFEPATFAFMLKQSALAVRAEARALGVPVRVAQPAIPLERWERERELWQRDIAPYIDVLPVIVAPGSPLPIVRSALETVVLESLGYPPAPSVWAVVEPASDSGADLASAIAALDSGAVVALVPAPADAAPSDPFLRELSHRLASGYGRAPLAGLSLESDGGAPELIARFVHATDLSNLVVYRAPGVADSGARLVVEGPALSAPRLVTGAGEPAPLVAAQQPGSPRRFALRVPPGAGPLAVAFEVPLALEGLDLPPEQVGVAATRGMTAEEIIARHQEVQREQDHRLERWLARGRADLHYKLSEAGSTIDLSIVSNYFWQRGEQLEWEQTDYFVNGNRITWKKIPELPLIQPEKVMALPLDLLLDRTYAYRLVNEERVGDREAYVLEFQPVAPDSPLSLYRGRVWIDRERFVKLKTSVIQTQLEPPVLSNEEIDIFAPVTDAQGAEYWMLSQVDGHQVWNVFGRTFVVRREIRFDPIEINPAADGFAARRAQAHASSHYMLRDTERGFRYLERGEDGTRVVKERSDPSRLLAGAGAFKDSSTDGVQPLAGVNYLNYDLGGRNIQLNAFFAGVLGFVTASKPDLFGGAADLSADAALVAIKFDDKVFQGDAEVLEERIEQRTQHLNLRLGLPLGKFVKVNFAAGLAWRQYFADEEAESALARFNATSPGPVLRFVLPQDHLERTGSAEVEFNRRGYTLRGRYAHAWRGAWEAWGLFDDAGGTFGTFDTAADAFVPAPPEAAPSSFERYAVAAFKEWYLPRFQKLRAEVNYLDGSQLDRFSRYAFSFFGEERLDGFAGSGVRFDEGTIVRAGYSFNLFEVVRLDAGVAQARVRNRVVGTGHQAFTGAGLSANLVGPWRTVISGSYGRALASDIAELEGEQEFMLLVLKLF